MGAQECIYCGESVERADDGAWQGVEDGACGCTASLEQGGDGEHDGEGGGACVECGAPLAFHWTGSCPEPARELGLVDEHGAYTAKAFEVIDAAVEPTFIERFGSTDAGFEERILDAEIAAAEGRPDREE